MGRPVLGIVVPFQNVATFLPSCLESIVAQSVEDIGIVLVNDQSSDSSGAIAEEFARRDRRFSVVHLEQHGGLGAARNIGQQHIDSDYLAFVDGDDQVTPDGFEKLLNSARASRSDIATGRVARMTSTRTDPSPQHLRAIPVAKTNTHITRQPSLLYDVPIWNKVFRMDFWRHHRLRHPEGVLYEDAAISTEAHVRALAVDMLTSTVYRWRQRDDGSLSITQRRHELANLRDRIHSLNSITEFLTINGPTSLLVHHHRKVLSSDLPLYLPELMDAGPEYAHSFIELVQGYLRTSGRGATRRLSAALQLKYELVKAGDADALIELLRYEAENSSIPVRRQGRRMVMVVPRSTTAIVSPAALNMSRRLPVRSGVDSIRWHRGAMVIDGFAHIESVPLQVPFAAVRRLVLQQTGGSRRVTLWLRPRRRPERTAAAGAPNLGYDWSGFRVRINADRLAPRSGALDVSWDAVVQVLTPVAAGGSKLGPPKSGAAWIPPIGQVGDLTIVPQWKDLNSLLLKVSSGRPILVTAQIDDEGIGVSISAPTNSLGAGPTLLVQTADGFVTVDLSVTGVDDARTLLAGGIPVSVLSGVVGNHVELPLYLVTAAGPRQVIPAFPDETAAVVGDREILVRRGGDGNARIVVRRPWVVATAAERAQGRLVVQGRIALPAGDTPGIFLQGPGGARLPGEIRRGGGTFQVSFNLLEVPAGGTRQQVRTGRWTLRRDSPDDPDLITNVPAATGAAAAIEVASSDTQPYWKAWVNRYRTVSVTVHALPISERGGFNQHRLRTTLYTQARGRPLQDVILFESWQGKQYSDNPRAISEELARRGDSRRRVWVVRDGSVLVPSGVDTVVRGSADYFRALATSRWLVSNDAMTPHLVKRDDQIYLQTWHGTPMKRIGFDIETIHFRNKRYLDELPNEVAKWDFLLSPDHSSTETLRGAFHFQGQMLETGYPRNDVLRRPDAPDIGRRTRKSLGLDPEAQVVLWAPTWRDHQYDGSGRYTIAMNDDIRRLAASLGEAGVLLFRGHHLVSASIDDDVVRGLVRNVSDYPDIAELYLASDVLITDYSSVMFDYAALGRPILIYAWDLEEYRDDIRGFYVDFERSAPSPVMTQVDDVIDALGDLPEFMTRNRARYQRFIERYCHLSDAQAAGRVVESVFG